MLGQRIDSASARIINHDFALDQPVYIRFLIFVNDLLPLSVYNRKVKESPIYLDPAKYKKAFKMFYFGPNKAIVFKSPYLRRSYHNKEGVYDMIKDRFNDTALLLIASLVLAVLFGVLFGILAAVRRKTWIGKLINAFSLVGISLPVFFIAVLVAWIFGFMLHRFTGLNMTGGLFSIDPFEGEYINWKNLVLPAAVLALRPMALIIRQTQRLFLDVMSQPYILTAKAKGVRRPMIVLNHAWINTTAPLVLLSERWFGSLLASAVLVEFIFGWNGIGTLLVNAIKYNDMPVLMGIVLCVSVFYILVQTFMAMLYSTLDPRTELKIKI